MVAHTAGRAMDHLQPESPEEQRHVAKQAEIDRKEDGAGNRQRAHDRDVDRAMLMGARVVVLKK